MIKLRILLTIALLLPCAPALSAESIRLQCEFWHKRLGQLDDKRYLINFDAKTCNGEPCMISETELKWQEEGGRVDVKIDRASSAGALAVFAEETALLKNCKATTPKV